jgi:putative glutamine amidotransferase
VQVETCPGSRLRALVGERHRVGCHHHQSVRAHPGFQPAAFAADGTLEAIERPGDRFSLAVQWHPEVREDIGLFRGLIAAATGEPAVTD